MAMKRWPMLLALALATPLAAAEPGASTARETARPRLRLGGTLGLGLPTGEFRDHVDLAGGVAGHAVYALAGPLSARLDGGFLLYGTETVRTPLRGTEGRVLRDVATTDNWIAHLTAGPQLAATSGRLRPYLNAFAGVSYFSTTSQLTRPARGLIATQPRVQLWPHFVMSEDPYLTTTHFDDAAFSYGAGAGLLVRLGGGGTALDLGVRYMANGRVRYLADGDFDPRLDPAGQARRSKADLFELRVGLTAFR